MIKIDKSVLESLTAFARDAFPNECCGLLRGTFQSCDHVVEIISVIPSPNVTANDPHRFFEIDPEVQFAELKRDRENPAGSRIIGHFHSHTNGSEFLSSHDLALAPDFDHISIVCALASQNDIPKLAAYCFESSTHQYRSIPFQITDNESP